MPPHRHSPTERHRSTDDATGANITAGWLEAADGSGGVEWVAPSVVTEGGVDSDLVRFLDIGLSGSAFTLDWADAPSQYVELDDDTDATLTGIPATVDGDTVEGRGRLWIETDGTFTVTWPVTVVWADGAPDLSAAGIYFIDFATYDGGTTFYGDFGGSSSVVLSDDTPLVESGAGDPGVSEEASRADHVHPEFGVTAADLEALGVVGAILISDDHSTPIVFADILLTEAGDDILYADLGG